MSRCLGLLSLICLINLTESSEYCGRIERLAADPLQRRRCCPSSPNYFDFLLVSQSPTSPYTEQMDHEVHSAHSAWPPWPFNLLSPSRRQSGVTRNDGSPLREDPSLILPFLRASARTALMQARVVASQLWLHAPPAAPPLVLLALLPQRQVGAQGVARTVIPLFTNPTVRSLALGGAGLAVMSWAHAQVLRKRLLAPLPLPHPDLARAVLPPFLPDTARYDGDEDGPGGDHAATAGADAASASATARGAVDEPAGAVPRALRHFLAKPGGVTLADWRRLRRERQVERQMTRRVEAMEQCIALQKLKKQQRGSNHWKKSKNGEGQVLGFALVTGASKGLGRAIAVELARWGFPLILVSRDLDRLTALACDLEACYGIKCCVLPADLTKAGVAEKVYQATTNAGMNVDVLVNNAGISSQGQSVDLPLDDIKSMVELNVMSVSALTHLYGKDMKERRRGRVLMVSSICGAVAGIPSVAVYAATKAFEKSLSLSIAKEMERFGVGVTCLMPGAVSETGFRKSSNSEDALCWKIPFYARPPQQIAEDGVRALLRGDTEVMPGWLNRAFIKLMMPIFPQRLHNWVAEIMWNPLNLPFRSSSRPQLHHDEIEHHRDMPVSQSESRFKFQSPPRLLQLETLSSSSSSSSSSSIEPSSETPDQSSLIEDSSSEKMVQEGSENILSQANITAPLE